MPTTSKRAALRPITIKRKRKYAMPASAIAERRPGVITTILSLMSLPSGATIPEMITRLKKRFPDRREAGMEITARANAGKYSRRRAREQTGRVRYWL